MAKTDDILSINDLEFDPTNPRLRTDRSSTMIRSSLEQFGALRSLVGQRLPDGRIIVRAGNGTLHEASQVGIDKVRVVERKPDELVIVVADDLDESQWKSYSIADNRSSDLSDWNIENLQDYADEGIGVGDWFTVEEMAGWDAEPGEWGDPLLTEEEDEENAADLIEKADTGKIESRVKLGEIWQLGRHRIACGDSTDEANVRKLLGGEKIQIIFSDPPYGVDYDGGTRKREKLENDHAGTDIYEKFFSGIRSSLDPKCPFYIWYAEPISVPVLMAIEKNKLQIRSVIVWNKNLAQFGALSAQYKQKHEPCLYMHIKGQSPYWFGATNEVTVWDVDRESANKFHPTQKPTDLAERALTNSSDSSAIVFDGFLGSGSTLIAAQKMDGNRRVFGFELSPDYCEVIIRRWEEYTGGTAELAGHL